MKKVQTNEEVVLQNKLILCPDKIEEGLKLIERETVVGSTKKVRYFIQR